MPAPFYAADLNAKAVMVLLGNASSPDLRHRHGWSILHVHEPSCSLREPLSLNRCLDGLFAGLAVRC